MVAAAESKAAALQEQERVARVQAEDRDWLENGAARSEAIARLKACLDEKPWAWTKRKRELAAAILEYPDRPTERAARIAGELVDEV